MILTEAGGVLSELEGVPLRYNRPQLRRDMLVAAPQAIFPESLALGASHFQGRHMSETTTQNGGAPKQALHLVFGGELDRPPGRRLPRPVENRHRRHLFRQCRRALAAWKAKAHATVDNAHMRYFVVQLHSLLDPDDELS